MNNVVGDLKDVTNMHVTKNEATFAVKNATTLILWEVLTL